MSEISQAHGAPHLYITKDETDSPLYTAALDSILISSENQEPLQLDFDSEDTKTGGSKRPTKTRLRAIHPEHGEVGYLSYYQPKRKADGILVDRLEVPPEHQGNGYASALMDEMQRRHPGIKIDHGDRTDAGLAWWNAYTRGKKVNRGRTIAKFENIKE